MHQIFLDFETRSVADLKVVGSWEYALHNTTRVNCMAWAVDDEPVSIWSHGDPFPRKLQYYIDKQAEMHAWNAQFERHIWMLCLYRKCGWPQINFNRWYCTAAKSRHANHPGKLAAAADMLTPHLAGKDKEGGTLMKSMAQPQKWTKKELKNGATGLKWIEDPISQALLEGYCKQDVVVERTLDRLLPDWPESEVEVWRINERINDRGVPLDRGLCSAANDILSQTLEESSKKISKLTDGVITTGNQIQRIKEFVNERGMNVDSLKAEILDKLMETELDPECRDILQMRQVTAGAAAKKYKSAMGVISDDDRGRGLFMYYGGSTGRFASLKTQIQNMKHGSDTTGTFREAVVSRDLDLMHLLYGDAIVTELGKNVRSMVCAPEGSTIVRCDSSQIECRVLHWLAGNEPSLQTFRDGLDPYLVFASSVYGYTVKKCKAEEDEAEYKKRQLGKAAVLGLGFGMGAKRFVGSADEGYGVQLTAKFAQYVVDLWRKENPLVLKFWSNLESAARRCVKHRCKVRVGHLQFAMWKDYMVLRLPSGRCLFYYKPAFVKVDGKSKFRYTSVRGVRHEWAGGILCENAVQAVARDTLVHYMKRAMQQGLDIMAHIHDELMVECPLKHAVRVEQIMLECFASTLPWMKGLPCAAETTVWRRYAG